jgi:hypothetical protein
MLRARKTGQESAAVQVLRSLRGAETGFKTNKHRYGDLSDLAGDGACTIGESGSEKSSGYTFTSVAGEENYTIVAVPPISDMSTYTLNEQGILNFQ